MNFHNAVDLIRKYNVLQKEIPWVTLSFLTNIIRLACLLSCQNDLVYRLRGESVLNQQYLKTNNMKEIVAEHIMDKLFIAKSFTSYTEIHGRSM